MTSKPHYLVFVVVLLSSMATFMTLLRVIVLDADRLLDFPSGKAGPRRISTTQLLVLKQVLGQLEQKIFCSGVSFC